jgi:hypothetical protein
LDVKTEEGSTSREVEGELETLEKWRPFSEALRPPLRGHPASDLHTLVLEDEPAERLCFFPFSSSNSISPTSESSLSSADMPATSAQKIILGLMTWGEEGTAGARVHKIEDCEK